MNLILRNMTQCVGKHSGIARIFFTRTLYGANFLSSLISRLCGRCENGVINDCFLDGCIPGNGVQRPIMTVNHEMPGPPISCCKGDRIIVDVTNNMAGEEVTIHWHGLHQTSSPWFDGVPMVTQCPIFAGTSFRYAFYAQQPGTHYYHAHSGLQRNLSIR